jgi:hypothetical protein
MNHTDYAIGQTWYTNRGRWERTWSIVDVDHRTSVTFLKVDPCPISDSRAKWMGSEVFTHVMEQQGARRVS